MNPQSLLEQFLGPDASKAAGSAMQNTKNTIAGSGMGGVAGGLAAGGLLGALLGNKKMRKKTGKIAGGVVGYGGAAALGALALHAYQKYQSNQSAGAAPAPTAQMPSGQPTLSTNPHMGAQPPQPAAADGKPFELAIVLAMIAAANADGHIDADEQRRIFDKVGELPLSAEDKAFVFDALGNPPSLQDIASQAGGPEQAAELYLASRLAIDPDHPMEQAYLQGLAHRMSLPPALVDALEHQAASVSLIA